MKLHLSADLNVKTLKKQFSALFPYLKIELFRLHHSKDEGSLKEQLAPDKLKLFEVTGILKEGEARMEPSMKVSEFEQMMQDDFGLPVQVFRKAGDIWLETVQTDSLSLEKQNHMGMESVKPVKSRFNLNTLFL